MKTPLLFLAVLALVAPGVAAAQRPSRDAETALEGRRAGQLLPMREIEGQVIPRMGGARYIGPEILDEGHYRLKFMRGSKVIWVDVDGRTGAIVGRAGD